MRALGSFDYVVVGAGSAGAIVAARLAASDDAAVCLLEAGPSDEGDDRILDVRRWPSLVGSDIVRTYSAETGDGGERPLHSRAIVVGGCGSHNQCIAFAPPTADLRRWEALGATGWGPEATASALERVLERVHVEEAPHANACARAFVEAARAAGFPLVSFASPDSAEGVGWLRLNARGRLRQSSSVAYLHPLSDLPDNLSLLTETPALRVVLREDEAIGVETARGTVQARREVILCAGALESPKLLMLSGIGRSETVAAQGIDVRVDLPGVGGHLLDHPEATLVWAASRTVPTRVAQDWETALFAQSDRALEEPDLMIHFGTMPVPAGLLAPAFGVAEQAFWMTPNVTRPKSVGRLALRSADPASPPLLDFAYYSDPDGSDAATMLAAIKLARRIASSPPLADWVERELAPGASADSDEQLTRYIRRYGTTVHHPAGTCRMGAADDPGAVVDPELRVRGVRRLRVADASVFPAMIGVNPNLTCMMIGERCAELIRGG